MGGGSTWVAYLVCGVVTGDVSFVQLDSVEDIGVWDRSRGGADRSPLPFFATLIRRMTTVCISFKQSSSKGLLVPLKD